MIDKLLDTRREDDKKLLQKTTMATLKLGGDEEVVAMNMSLPILHTKKDVLIDKLVRIEIMESQKIKGWLYQNVHAITFPTRTGGRILVRRSIVEEMVKTGCADKTYSEEPKLHTLQKIEDRTVAYLSISDLELYADITY